MKYEVHAPNGKIYDIIGPEGATEEQVRAEVLRQYPEAGMERVPGGGPEVDPEFGLGGLPSLKDVKALHRMKNPEPVEFKAPPPKRVTGNKLVDTLLPEVEEQMRLYGQVDPRLLEQIKEYKGQPPDVPTFPKEQGWPPPVKGVPPQMPVPPGQMPSVMTAGTPESFIPADWNPLSSQQGPGRQVREGAKDLARGVLGSVGFLSGADPMKWLGIDNKYTETMSAKALQRKIRETGLDLRPEPTEGLEDYRKAGLEFAGGMAGGGVGTLMKRLLTGVLAGTSGEAAVKGLGEPARLPAELLSLLVPGYAAQKTPGTVNALKNIVKDVSGELPKAKERVDRAYSWVGDPEARGLISQGLTRPSQFEAVVNSLVGGQHGLTAQKMLQKQLESTVQKGQSWIEDLVAPTKKAVQPGQAALTSAAGLQPAPEGSKLLKGYFDRHMREALSGDPGRIPQEAPERFLKAVGGELNGKPDSRRKALLDTIHANATERGLDPDAAVKNFNELINAFEVASRGRQGMGKANMAEAERAMGANIGSALIRAPVIGFTSGSPAAARLERRIAKQGWEAFMDAITDPTKVEYLNHIAKYSPASQRINTLLTGAMGISGYHTEKE